MWTASKSSAAARAKASFSDCFEVPIEFIERESDFVVTFCEDEIKNSFQRVQVNAAPFVDDAKYRGLWNVIVI